MVGSEDLFKGTEREAALHTGRTPGETAKVSPAMRLVSLNEALNETLSREDYEQAAWLRDQIKKLTAKKKNQDGGV